MMTGTAPRTGASEEGRQTVEDVACFRFLLYSQPCEQFVRAESFHRKQSGL